MRNLFAPLAIAAATISVPTSLYAAIFLNGEEIDGIEISTGPAGNVLIVTEETGSSSGTTSSGTTSSGTTSSGTTSSGTTSSGTTSSGTTSSGTTSSGTTSSGTTSSGTTSSSGTTIDPECGEIPETIDPIDSVNWALTPSQTRISLGRTGSAATEFTATAGTSYGGQISVASTTGNSGVQRRVWISQCPGGEPLADPKCEQTGTSSTVIKWFQGAQHRSYCNLTPGTRYFINYTNETCTTNNCDVYRNLYNNGRPN